MIIITRSRDRASKMQKVFFPYFLLLAVSKVNELDVRTNEYFTCKILLPIISEVQRKFGVKLRSTVDKFRFKLSEAEGITRYSFMMQFPIKADQHYLLNMRQQMCDQIFHQLVQLCSRRFCPPVKFKNGVLGKHINSVAKGPVIPNRRASRFGIRKRSPISLHNARRKKQNAKKHQKKIQSTKGKG